MVTLAGMLGAEGMVEVRETFYRPRSLHGSYLCLHRPQTFASMAFQESICPPIGDTCM